MPCKLEGVLQPCHWTANLLGLPGGWDQRNQRINPMQCKLPMHLSARCGAPTRNKNPLPITSDAERSLPHARRKVLRRA